MRRDHSLRRSLFYHHFGGKVDLFCAVYEQIESELTAEIAQVILDQERITTACVSVTAWPCAGLSTILTVSASL